MLLNRHPVYNVNLDYPFASKPRYTRDVPHRKLNEIIDCGRQAYLEILKDMMRYTGDFSTISVKTDKVTNNPNWDNDWFPVLDAMVLYYFLVKNNPDIYLEVGSGYSTKFARKAIADHGLRTRIISIDPYPRADIDALCDQVIRQKLEDVDLSVFEALGAGDIVFIDNSHRMFMNSDATVAFLDVVPVLNRGVLLQFHDICLPYDYPDEWVSRYYSEQYGLACYLLAQGPRLSTLFPCKFIVCDEELYAEVDALCRESGVGELPRNGCSYWLAIN